MAMLKRDFTVIENPWLNVCLPASPQILNYISTWLIVLSFFKSNNNLFNIVAFGIYILRV